MSHEASYDYHLRRARAELDLAYRSECHAAMESHLRLSSLHMQRLGGLKASVRPSGADLPRNQARRIPAFRSPERVAKIGETEAVCS